MVKWHFQQKGGSSIKQCLLGNLIKEVEIAGYYIYY